MSKFCLPLRLVKNPFNELIDTLNLNKSRHLKLDHEKVINDSVKNFFLNLNLDIDLVELFYTPPYFRSSIHTDSAGGNYTKINWIFGGEGSSMNWYSVKPEIQKSLNDSPIGTNFTSYIEKEVDLIHSEKLYEPTLVQVGVPHNIKNGPKHRWCVSFVFTNSTNKTRPTMQESLEIFKDYIIGS